jgi:hypothetical protein
MVEYTHFPISTLPAPYDIVWCHFPEHTSIGNPSLKPRPALVRSVATIDGERGEVQVVYGTSKLKMMERRQDFFISNHAEMDACGLYRATRFDLDKVAWIPWAIEWFDILPDYNSPIIGHLTAHSIKKLQTLVSYRQASLSLDK